MAKRGPKGPSKYTEAFIEAEADALLEYATTAPIPFLKDFCWQRGYGSQRISEFERNSKFSEALNRFKDRLETILVFGGLENKLNSYMAMNTLKNVAGWRDKQPDEENKNQNIIINVVHAKISGHPDGALSGNRTSLATVNPGE